jgi:hypothetical protein
MNKWLISKEIKNIKEDQQNLCDKWSGVKAFQQIMTPKLRLAAAQVLNNQRNEASAIAEDPEHLWNKMKYPMLIRLFKQFEQEKHDWMVADTTWPEGANLKGLRNDNRAIVLEDGQDTVWTVDTVEKELKTRWHDVALQDLRTVCGITPEMELVSIMAMEIAMEIVSEVKRDIEKLYCKNNILQYNYYLHSFRLGETRLDDESFCPRTPLLMKYIKTATFGD